MGLPLTVKNNTFATQARRDIAFDCGGSHEVDFETTIARHGLAFDCEKTILLQYRPDETLRLTAGAAARQNSSAQNVCFETMTFRLIVKSQRKNRRLPSDPRLCFQTHFPREQPPLRESRQLPQITYRHVINLLFFLFISAYTYI